MTYLFQNFEIPSYYVFSIYLRLFISFFFSKCKTGDVELKNMQLKPEALNALKLPVKVKAGFLGSVKLKVGVLKFLSIRHKCNCDADVV